MFLTGIDKIIFIISLILNGNFLLFSAFLFFKKTGNTKANRILACGLVIIVYVNVVLSLYNTRFFYHFPHLTGIHLPFLFTIILSPYFYFLAVLEPDFQFKKSHFAHILLPLAVLIYSMFHHYLKSTGYKLDFLRNHLYDRHYFFSALVYIQLIVYLILIYRQYRLIKKSITPESLQNQQVIKWLKEFLWIICLIFLGEIIPVFLIPFRLDPLLYIPLINSAFFYLLVYKAVVNPAIFQKLELINKSLDNALKNKGYVPRETDIRQMKEILDKVLNDKTLFFKPEMSLAFLSKSLDIQEHHLTYLINNQYKRNFKDLVNSVRIEEVKKRLTDPDFHKLTIEAISESVGFVSRSSFHHVFKKYTGLTPADYKRKCSIG